MFQIGEFSKLTQVSVRMLRYYGETGLLIPARIDSDTGYRYYSVEQIPVLNKIVYLRDSGFAVAEIAAALRTWEPPILLEQLKEKQREIETSIAAEKNKLQKIALAQKELMNGKSEMHYTITMKSVPSYFVLSLRKVIPDYYAECNLWLELADFARRNHISINSETFSIYHDPDYKEKDVDVELCAFVDEKHPNEEGFTFRYTEPVEKMACTMVYGEFANIAGAYLSFAHWLQTNSQYRMAKTSRQIVHRGPWNETNPAHYLVEIQIPLENA